MTGNAERRSYPVGQCGTCGRQITYVAGIGRWVDLLANTEADRHACGKNPHRPAEDAAPRHG